MVMDIIQPGMSSLRTDTIPAAASTRSTVPVKANSWGSVDVLAPSSCGALHAKSRRAQRATAGRLAGFIVSIVFGYSRGGPWAYRDGG
jgi:hypothetical protein